MTEWTFVTVPTTSIGEMKLAPNMLLALVGLGISRRTPCILLGLPFPFGMCLGFALWKNGSCIIWFSITLVGLSTGRRWWCRFGWSSKEVLSLQHLA